MNRKRTTSTRQLGTQLYNLGYVVQLTVVAVGEAGAGSVAGAKLERLSCAAMELETGTCSLTHRHIHTHRPTHTHTLTHMHTHTYTHTHTHTHTHTYTQTKSSFA